MYPARFSSPPRQAPIDLPDDVAIRGALAAGTLEVRYEAQFDWRKQVVVGAVAKLFAADNPIAIRSDLIRVAAEQGWEHLLVSDLLISACRQMHSWLRLPQLERVVVPVCRPQLLCPLFLDNVRQALVKADLASSRLEIEIPDSAAADFPGAVFCLLRRLRALGLSIAVTMSGTNHLSLAYTGRELIDRIKIDSSLISAAKDDSQALERICTIISVARNFGIEIAAAGVDHEFQREFLVELGCELLQGGQFGGLAADFVIE